MHSYNIMLGSGGIGCLGVAGYLASIDANGWGWFLLVGFLALGGLMCSSKE